MLMGKYFKEIFPLPNHVPFFCYRLFRKKFLAQSTTNSSNRVTRSRVGKITLEIILLLATAVLICPYKPTCAGNTKFENNYDFIICAAKIEIRTSNTVLLKKNSA